MGLGDPYVTADDLASELGIDDAEDIDTMGLSCAAASTWVTQYCGRDFQKATTATARIFDYKGCGPLEVDDFWTTSGLIIGTDDDDDGTFETTWLTSNYELGPRNGMWDGLSGFPYFHLRGTDRTFPTFGHRTGRVQVTAKWGWTEVPAAVTKATLIHAAQLWKRKDSPEGVLGGFGDFGVVRVGTRVDPNVEALLMPYRKRRYGY